MTAARKGQADCIEEVDERAGIAETTPLLQTSLSQLDIAIVNNDTTEPYIHAARRELRWMASSSTLTILTNVLQSSFLFVNVISVGHLGAKTLAAMSLCMTCQGIFAMAPMFGLLSAMDTFCSTAYTASRDKKLVGFHFQRGLIAVCIHFLLVLPLFLNAETLLLFLRQDPEIARFSGMYLRIQIVSILPFVLFEATKRYLQAQGIMHAATLIAVIAAPIHWTNCFLLVRSTRFGMGFVGVPVINIITNWSMVVGIFIYVCNSRAMETWGGWSLSAFQNMQAYYRLAIPSVITTCADWVCYELLAIGSSYFGADQLAGNAVILNTVQVIFQFSNGLGVGTSPRIGNLIGAAKPRQAHIAADMAILASAVIGLMGVLMLSLRGDWWISVYTDVPSVAREAAKMIPIACIFSVSNGLNAVLSAILRGLGRQRISANILLFGFYVCALPTGLYLAYVKHLETPGLWRGACIGVVITSVLHIVYIYTIVDWKNEVRRCILRLKANSNSNRNNNNNNNNNNNEGSESSESSVVERIGAD
ncbi:ethionine resistance protein [Coemansia sp. RSA 1939]|nr:ethionine resistance protein [Coemansia sp. RSA 1939]